LPTDSLLSVFIFAFLVSVGAVVSPGPVSAAIISESPRQGWRVGPLVASAHVGLEAVIVLLIALGLNSGLASPAIERTIAFGGGLILLYMGATYLFGAVTGRLTLPGNPRAAERHSPLTLLSLGFMTTLSNPFWYAWWVTVAAGFLSQAASLGAAGVLAFYLGHVSADLSWDSFLAVASSLGGRLLSPGAYRGLLIFTSVFMAYMGVVFIRAGMRM
jgi:threonine/homoserine/homoserine lactone efflux protein